MPGDLVVDVSQVHSIEVDPSQVSLISQQQQAIQQPQGSAFGRLTGGLWDTTVGGLGHLAKSVISLAGQAAGGGPVMIDPNSAGGKAIAGLVQSHVEQAQKAKAALDRGDYTEAFGHTLATALPLLGPAAAHAGERLGGSPPQFDKYGNVVQPGQAPDIAGGLGETMGLVGTAAAPAIGRAVQARLPESVRVPPVLKTTLNPVEQAAVDFLRSRNVPLAPGTVTGNRFVKAAQAVTQNSPLGATAAAEFGHATEQGLTRVAGELGNEASEIPATPESAGAAVVRKLQSKIEGLADVENAAYEKAWQGRNNPQFTYRMPVRMEEQPALNAEGKPSGQTEQVPVMKPVNMPVDVRDIKNALKPIYEEMQWMPASDRASSAGYQAAKNILEGDDFIPAWQAEKGLSGLKSMARTSNLSGVRNTSQGIGASIIPDLQDAVDAAVANTGEDAIHGLQQGRATHAGKMELADITDHLRTEPVRTFNKLIWRGDTGIAFLRQIADQAPDVLPQIGRAYVDQLFEQATREGGFGRARNLLNQWANLGPQTKAVLFPRPALRAGLDRFFKGAEMVAQNPNPSGTALVQSASSLNPLRWLAGYAGSKLLYSPRGAAILTQGWRVPLGGARGAIAENALKRLAEDQGPPENPDPPLPGGEGGPAAPANPAGGPPGPDTSPGELATDSIRGTGVSDAQRRVDAGTAREGQTDTEPAGAGSGAGAEASATEIRIPGVTKRYSATYEVRELADVQASHSGASFQPNPKYALRNDRDYSRAENQGKVVAWSGPEFDPSYHITDNPDATNGPPVIDAAGNVYGGNGRTMILHRVYQSNPAGANAYRQLLMRKAGQFGVDWRQVRAMKEPVLVRVIPDEELATATARQQAVTDFNKTGTAALRGSEKAIADSRRVSQGTLDHIAGQLEEAGPDATLTDVLNNNGSEILHKLIGDNVISPQEIAGYIDRGDLTPAGKERISKLMLGRFFRDPAQLDRTPASIRNKLERIAAPLAKVEGRPEWSLSPQIQQAVELIEEARAHGQKNLDDVVSQSGLFGAQTYSPEAVLLAKLLQHANPNDLTKSVRQYAQDAAEAEQGPGLFGSPPTRGEAFTAAFQK